MKFKIRYADQIVGALAILAFVALVAVIILLGAKQRWFSKDYTFRTTLETATGISVGMPLQYKGFTIGKVKSISLNPDDRVDVRFVVYDTYYDRVRQGTLVELIINPIGLGNQFLLYPGSGTGLLAENAFIPRADTSEGKATIDAGLCVVPKRDDTITNLIAQVNPLLTNLNDTLGQLNGAFRGTGKGPLAQTLSGVAGTMTNLSGITGQLYGSLDAILGNVRAITANLEAVTSSPAGMVPALIDPDGTMFDNLEKTFASVSGTLLNLEGSTAILKTEMPQIARLIEDLRLALVKGQDVLEALRNNPILKNGVPERVQTDSSGTNSRNIDF